VTRLGALPRYETTIHGSHFMSHESLEGSSHIMAVGTMQIMPPKRSSQLFFLSCHSPIACVLLAAQIDIASTSELPTMSGHANVRINLNYTNFGQVNLGGNVLQLFFVTCACSSARRFELGMVGALYQCLAANLSAN
jgi:hypothetical protein